MRAIELGIPTQITDQLHTFKNMGRLAEYEHQTKFQTVKIFVESGCKLMICPSGRYYLLPHPGGAVHFEEGVVEFTGLELVGFRMQEVNYTFGPDKTKSTRLMLSHPMVSLLPILQQIHSTYHIEVVSFLPSPIRPDRSPYVPVYHPFHPAHSFSGRN